MYDIPINRIICGIQFLAVKSEEHVAVAETGILHLLAEIHTLGHCMEGNYIIAPVQRYAHIYHNGKHEIEAHAGYHYAQTLPRRLGTQFPALRLRREVVGTLGFIYHAGNIAVAAERQPAEAVYGVAPCRLAVKPCEVLPPYFQRENAFAAVAGKNIERPFGGVVA